MAITQPKLNTDDVWEHLHMLKSCTHEPRAMGGIMTGSAGLGYITKDISNLVPSQRRLSHNRPIQVWKSCTYIPIAGEPDGERDEQ